MRRDEIHIDFFVVPAQQSAMHDRLLNWARWVTVRPGSWQAPMWRQGKSNTRQWHAPEVREAVDTLDGLALEKAIGALPVQHREAIRWFYVWKSSPLKIRRQLGVTSDGLMRLVKDGRSMLQNRRV